MKYPERDVRTVLSFANRISLMVGSFLVLVHLEAFYPWLFSYLEYFFFVFMLGAVVIKKYDINRVKYQPLPFLLLYLVILTPLIRTMLLKLAPALVYLLGGVCGIVAMLGTPTVAEIHIVLTTVLVTSQIVHPSSTNGFLFTSAFIMFGIVRCTKSYNRHYLVVRALSWGLSIFSSNLVPSVAVSIAISINELFFTLVVPVTICILYQHKVLYKQRRREMSTQTGPEILPFNAASGSSQISQNQ
ncbi:hypothetical protein NEDG_01889 [Nematocida displodere]|uniref:Uncharacterized protein n=1 Tax=Nematocida displodere TaxID=1805483 RepID=A0A177EGM1_9MICR|nr:hypothetical protein NEDG_01889 [Nematocida displodere]